MALTDKAFRERVGALTALTGLQIDGQQLLKSERNGNYFLHLNGEHRPHLLSVVDCAGWLRVHGFPQLPDTAPYEHSNDNWADSDSFTPYKKTNKAEELTR